MTAEQVTPVETPEQEPQQETEKTYTQAEVDEALKGQYNTLNTKLSAQGAEIATQRAEIARFKAQPPQDMTAHKAVLTAMESAQVEGEVNPQLQQAKARVSAIEVQQQRDAQLAKQDAVADGHKAEITKRIRDAGLDPEDEQFEGVMDAFEYGRDVTGVFDKADSRLTRILTKLKPEEQPRDLKADIQEGIRAAMEKQGLLKVDGVTPAANKGDEEAIRERYINDPTNKENIEAWEPIRVRFYEDKKRQKAKEK